MLSGLSWELNPPHRLTTLFYSRGNKCTGMKPTKVGRPILYRVNTSSDFFINFLRTLLAAKNAYPRAPETHERLTNCLCCELCLLGSTKTTKTHHAALSRQLTDLGHVNDSYPESHEPTHARKHERTHARTHAHIGGNWQVGLPRCALKRWSDAKRAWLCTAAQNYRTNTTTMMWRPFESPRRGASPHNIITPYV